MASLGYIGQYSEEEQAKGIASLQTIIYHIPYTRNLQIYAIL